MTFSYYKRHSHLSRESKLSLYSRTLHIILEEDEPRSSTPSRSTSPAPSSDQELKYKRRHATVSMSEIHLNIHNDNGLVSSSPRQISPITPPRVSFPELRSETTSPTPSSSSSSSGLPSTPSSSDDEFPLMGFKPRPRRVSVKPLNITKNNLKGPTSNNISSFIESDSDDESDSEWYTREFSKILTLCSPLPPTYPVQQPSRPESWSLAMPSEEFPVPQPPSPKRPISHTHRRSRSIPKETPPPVPPIPQQFKPLPSPPLAEEAIKALGTPLTPITKPLTRSLSIRRPPPKTSIPADCVLDDILNDEEEGSYWSSAFDLSIYQQPSPMPSPVFISAPPQQQLLFPVPATLDSPTSIYSQATALLQQYQSTEDLEEFGEIEFAVEDVKFDLNMDMPMRLPLSLPDSPIDLEADIANGLEELRNRREQQGSSPDLVPPIIAISDVDAEGQEVHIPPPISSPTSVPTSPLPPSPGTPASFESFYSSNADSDIYVSECDAGNRPVLRSKWSSSTLASVREEQGFRSPTTFAANKLRLYFAGGNSPLSKSKQHKRSGSAAAIAAAKAAVARAAAGAIYHSPEYSPIASSFRPPVSPTVKKAQRQIVVVPPPPSPKTSSGSSSPPMSPMSPPYPYRYGKGKKRWNGKDSDVTVVGYGYGSQERELRRRGSLTPTVSDAGSVESSSSTASNGLRRKPIPVEMFLRSAGSP
ncbi:hypothetical protein AX17_005146 [Amanita inopinata Kibby_2008]|nr:hypothetical protein AX17_005146 [Amanita inopinata Kibby_2008]